MKYTYLDFLTGKIKWTKGEFIKWTERGGPLNVRFALFQRQRSTLLIPSHCLTSETRAAIAPEPKDQEVGT